MSELEAVFKKRKMQQGLAEEPLETKSEVIVIKKEQKTNEEFEKKRKMLQNMFEKKDGGGSCIVGSGEKKTEEIKGNADSFAEARKRLEQNLNKNNSSFSDLPPLPSLVGLPELPPPPPGQSTGFNLPTLPPPPSLDLLNLPPLPPPPPIDSQVTSLPPPPPLLVTPSSNIVLPPPPPIDSQITSLPPPPPPIISTPSSNIVLPPPPPLTTDVIVENCYVAEKLLPPPPVINVEVSNNSPVAKSKALVPPSEYKTSTPFEVIVKSKKEVKITNDCSSLTTSILGKDISGFIRSEFLKDVDILGMIGSKVEKKTYNFSFPSIENKTREGETEDVLYTDTSSLDVVSCFMKKNINAVKKHNEALDSFKKDSKNLKDFDKEKIKQIPSDLVYRQLNFTLIKNMLARCEILINKYKKAENFDGCAQIKNIRDGLKNSVSLYCKNPIENEKIYDEIESKVNYIKEVKV